MRRLFRTAAVAAIAGGMALLPTTPAHAEATFNLRAQADSMFFEADYAGAPASPTNQAGSLTSAAELNSVGNSKAFAAAPYYGSTAETLPGTVNGVLSGNGVPASVPVTSFPGYVASRYPSDPSNSAAQGDFKVSASSGPNSSSASGSNGAPDQIPAPNQQQVAKASVQADPSGTVVSTATASVAGISMAPITDFSAVTTITVRQHPGAAPVAVETSRGSFTVAGQGVTFDDKGFKLAGQALPTSDGLAQVNAVLANANTRIEAVPATQVRDPGSGQVVYTLSALRVETANSVPTQSDAKLVYELARVEVRSSSAIAGGDSGIGVGPVADSGSGASTSAAPSATGAANAPAIGAVGAPGASGGAPIPPPITAGDQSTAPTGPRLLGLVRSRALQGSDNELLYLTLVLGGLVLFVGQQVFSRFGIRLLLLPASRN